MLETELIPPPVVIQERLARNYREARLLRSLLRLSHQSVRSRAEHERAYRAAGYRATHEAAGREAIH